MEKRDDKYIIESISSRDKMIRYLDGYSAERKEELDERKSKKPLVKSYLIELMGNSVIDISEIMSRNGITLKQIDEDLYSIYASMYNQNKSEHIGFIEILTNRYFVIYTLLESKVCDPWVKALILGSSEFDHVWLSGLTFNVLWNKIVQLNHPNRYAKIVFMHDSVYQVDGESLELEEDEEEAADKYFDEADNLDIVERRASKFSLIDRISVVEEKLNELQRIYTPLYAISQLRFPSPVGSGGHDFYDFGKVTNRSGNFRDHRAHILYVQRVYDKLIKLTEAKTWYSIQKSEVSIPGIFQKLIGAPLSIKFSEPLSNETFNYWIKSTFCRLRNKFRLWGNPIRLGPQKVHVYGVDKHLWQPIFMEITSKHLIAIIPKGTCGNTVHRLVTNIQRYIDPAAGVFIGDISYQDMVKESTVGVEYERKH